ncbi:sensor histidine kinase [Rathayibacter soli]|uniref:sensor histidine kinase n=1 Tax=Rathayibacter soli TaxID=3144168 RepID=UPI0027E52946|nr:histidine kinase [Glaciibacter superstes]
MMHRERTRSPLARSLDRGLVLIAASGVLLAGIFLALVLPITPIAWLILLFTLAFFVYLAGGLLAWRLRPSNGMGPLIILCGYALFLGGLGNTETAGLDVVGEACTTLVFAVTLHLLIAFPSGRLHGWFERATVIAGYVVALVLQAPLYLFDGTGDVGAMTIAGRPDLVTLGTWVQRGAGAIVTMATAVILIERLRRSDRTHRRVLIPLFGYAIFAVLFVSFGSNVLDALFGPVPYLRPAAQVVVLGGIPIAFALCVLRGGFARTGELQELGAWLGTASDARPQLTSAVARTLGDDTLRVVFWVAERGAFVDADGHAATLPADSPDRELVEIELDGRLVGAIEYDSMLIGDPALVRTAGRVVAIAVDRERLTVELLASQQALLKSRSRLVEAADRERRRIAQDLHDGLQVQLVLLALQAGQLARAAEASRLVREGATTLRVGIDGAAADLRRIVHAVMPAALIEQGLSAAAEDLVDQMPVPTKLDIELDDGALSASVESTAYFVIAEGLTNALKHSEATAFAVHLERVNDLLLIEIRDDGVGGATPTRGTGLRGLSDRVDVVGGRLQIESEPGRGTHLRVELPCTS